MVLMCLPSIALGVISLGFRITEAAVPEITGYTTSTIAYVKDIAIADPWNMPTETGTPLSYAISPALPSTLAFDLVTGKISGTPNAAADGAEYSIIPTNDDGAGTAFKVYIAVVAEATAGIPAAVVYPAASKTGNVGTDVTITPTADATAALYTVSAVLPAGLTINVKTGVITGTPNAVTGSAAYTITTKNDKGDSGTPFVLTIEVSAASTTAAATPAVVTTAAATPAVVTTAAAAAAATTAAATTASGAASNDTNSTAVAVTSADGVAATTISATTVAMAICVAIFQ